MDRSKIDQQFDRRISKMASSIAQESGREPITDLDRSFYITKIVFEDSILQVKVISALDRVRGSFRGVNLDQRGNYLVFKIISVESEGTEKPLKVGTSVLAKWDNRNKEYKRFIHKENPDYHDLEVLAISSLTGIREKEVVDGKPW